MTGETPPLVRYSGIQPQYFPRLHYFARILNADIFIARDDAQFVRKHRYPDGSIGKSYQADTPIKQAYGVQLLGVPISHGGFRPISETPIDFQQKWPNSHLRSIEIAYSKSPQFKIIYPEIVSILSRKYPNLAALNLTSIYWGISKLLGLPLATVLDSPLDQINHALSDQTQFRLKSIKLASTSHTITIDRPTNPNEKILGLIKEFGSQEDYCGGTSLNAYVDLELFKRHKITLTVQDWHCQPYRQNFLNTTNFIPNLSIIDLLMHTSSQSAAQIIRG